MTRISNLMFLAAGVVQPAGISSLMLKTSGDVPTTDTLQTSGCMPTTCTLQPAGDRADRLSLDLRADRFDACHHTNRIEIAQHAANAAAGRRKGPSWLGRRACEGGRRDVSRNLSDQSGRTVGVVHRLPLGARGRSL